MQPSVLSEASWRSRQETHQARVDGWLTAHLQRRRGGRKHPVEDFLFSYYSYRPAQLRRWHPGAATILAGQSADDLGPGHVDTPAGATLDTVAVLDRRGDP